MNRSTIIILAVIAVAVITAIRYALKNPDPCSTCGGDKLSCTMDHCGRTPEERHNFYREQQLNDLWNQTSRRTD